MSTSTGAFAAVFAALYAAHSFGDHWWGQTHAQACGKGERTAQGRRHCAAHVLQLAAVKLAFLAALLLATGLRVSPAAVVVGLLVDAVSHYWADRRFTLAALAERTGKGDFYRLGAGQGHLGTGAYALDQSFHVLFLFIAALIIGGAS